MPSDEDSVLLTDNDQPEHENCISELLNDSEASELMIQRLTEGGHMMNGLAALASGGAGLFHNTYAFHAKLKR